MSFKSSLVSYKVEKFVVVGLFLHKIGYLSRDQRCYLFSKELYGGLLMLYLLYEDHISLFFILKSIWCPS